MEDKTQTKTQEMLVSDELIQTNIEKIIADFDKQFIGQLAEYDTTEGSGGYDPRPYIHEFITKAYQAGIKSKLEVVEGEILEFREATRNDGYGQYVATIDECIDIINKHK
jgi:parvulin-like peptidyl-prolyl isomerase